MNLLRALLRLICFLVLCTFQVLRLFLWKALASQPAEKRKAIKVCLGAWSRQTVKLLGIEVERQGSIPEFGSMILPNHRSYIDVVAFPPVVETTFVAKIEVYPWPVIGHGARVTDTVFVDRSSRESRRKTREEMGNRLSEGRFVVVFPEGTTYQAPEIGEFRPGMFTLAAEGGFPILPVALEYLHPTDAWIGKDTFIPHFIRCFGKKKTYLVARFGPVLRGDDGEALRREAHHWIKSNLEMIRQELSQQHMPKVS